MKLLERKLEVYVHEATPCEMNALDEAITCASTVAQESVEEI